MAPNYRIRQNNRHYAVESHSRSPNLVPIESPYATSYVWNVNSTGTSHLAPFPRYGGLFVKFRLSTFDRRYLCLAHSFGWTPKFRMAKFGLKNLETSIYSAMLCTLRYLEPFRRNSRVWQPERLTDGRTDRQTFSLQMPRFRKLQLECR